MDPEAGSEAYVLTEVHVSAHVECGAALIAEGARAAGVKHVSFRAGGGQEGKGLHRGLKGKRGLESRRKIEGSRHLLS